jgi:hypothetical protein
MGLPLTGGFLSLLSGSISMVSVSMAANRSRNCAASLSTVTSTAAGLFSELIASPFPSSFFPEQLQNVNKKIRQIGLFMVKAAELVKDKKGPETPAKTSTSGPFPFKSIPFISPGKPLPAMSALRLSGFFFR